MIKIINNIIRIITEIIIKQIKIWKIVKIMIKMNIGNNEDRRNHKIRNNDENNNTNIY